MTSIDKLLVDSVTNVRPNCTNQLSFSASSGPSEWGNSLVVAVFITRNNHIYCIFAPIKNLAASLSGNIIKPNFIKS